MQVKEREGTGMRWTAMDGKAREGNEREGKGRQCNHYGTGIITINMRCAINNTLPNVMGN
jgi:hypothetical protein